MIVDLKDLIPVKNHRIFWKTDNAIVEDLFIVPEYTDRDSR